MTKRNLPSLAASISKKIAASALLTLLPLGAAFAQSALPDLTAISTNGRVNAITVAPNGARYIGGDFTAVGPQVGNGMLLSATGIGTPDTSTFAGVAGTYIRTSAPDGSGGYYIGGEFDHVGGQKHVRVAHVLANGSADPNFNVGDTLLPDGPVFSLAVGSGVVYISGQFSHLANQAHNYLAALDSTTGLPTAWAPNPSSWADAMAVSGSTLYVGGEFFFIGANHAFRNYLAGVDTVTGDATSWAPEADSYVHSLIISGSSVYVGGVFSHVGGLARHYLAKLDLTTGNADSSFDPNPSYSVEGMAVSGGTLYLGGDFTSINSLTRHYAAAVDATTGADAGWDPDADDFVHTVAVVGSTIYLGGYFNHMNGGTIRNHLAAVDGSGTLTSWNPITDNYVSTLSTDGVKIYAGGAFVTAGPGVTSRNYVARLNSDGTVDNTWNPGADNIVHTLALSGSTLYVGGEFSHLGGQTRSRAGAVSVDTGIVTPWAPSIGAGDVFAIVVSPDGNNIYVGGDFLTLGSVGAYLGSVSSSGVVRSGWTPGPDGHIDTLAIADDGNTVYAGGTFTSIGGQNRQFIAALNATNGTATAWNPGASPFDPYAMQVANGVLYVGGGFTNIGGQQRAGLAALDLATGVPTAFNPPISLGGGHTIYSLSATPGLVYAGGLIGYVDGVLHNDIAAFDTTTGAATAWDPQVNLQVQAVAYSGGKVMLGGDFTSVGTHPIDHYAQVDAHILSASITPTTKDFGNLAVGQTASAQTFTFSNTGDADLSVSTAAIAGTNASDYAKSNDHCSGQSVAVGTSCSVDVSFTANVAGPSSGTLVFTDTAGGSPQSIPLTGNGTNPGSTASITPTSATFDTQAEGTPASPSKSFTVTNESNVSIAISSVTLTGANADQFVAVLGTCSGATLAKNATCVVKASFKPTSAGAKAATLNVISDANNSPQTVSLAGTATQAATPPNTTITKRPVASTRSTSATFAFTSNQSGSTFSCSVDQHSYRTCRSPYKISRLARGKHTFQVRATKNRVTDPSPAGYRWTIKK